MTDRREYLDRLYDEERLARFLERAVGPGGPLTVEYHQAGHSNETLFVGWGDRELVLRRPPAGETADAAHDVLREYRVMSALEDTAVPVPSTVAACEDRAVLGAEFYLMERLAGDVIRDVEPDRFAAPDQRRALSERFVDTLVEIHTLDPETVGLDDLGHPEGYTERQVERWTDQLEWAVEVTDDDRSVPELHTVADWLAANVPTEYDHTLLHGDYSLDNVMFGPGTPPDLVGVFDWEMSTRGDPLTDLGWTLAHWFDPEDPEFDDPLNSRVEASPGYLTRRELLDRYEEQTGRAFSNERFYRTFGVFKTASTCEMMYRRHLEGNADNPNYPLMEEYVPALGERARRIIDGEEPL
ncbi:phosphotransferase family protein [Halomarina salina]|uniref:Phosphotransferase family protein n=1 Tax=Halomarina salina TaxID=1872699 RepID=A0ABD5RTH7_9EURY|nr:phosphotransferase family protein [Halomarina salina]